MIGGDWGQQTLNKKCATLVVLLSIMTTSVHRVLGGNRRIDGGRSVRRRNANLELPTSCEIHTLLWLQTIETQTIHFLNISKTIRPRIDAAHSGAISRNSNSRFKFIAKFAFTVRSV